MYFVFQLFVVEVGAAPPSGPTLGATHMPPEFNLVTPVLRELIKLTTRLSTVYKTDRPWTVGVQANGAISLHLTTPPSNVQG